MYDIMYEYELNDRFDFDWNHGGRRAIEIVSVLFEDVPSFF